MTVTILHIVCMYCKSVMGSKDGQGISGDSHSICCKCWQERFPEWEYPVKGRVSEDKFAVLNLSVISPHGENIGWCSMETDPNWWEIYLWLRRS